MGFFKVLTRVTELLQHEGRVSYRAIKREWHLDDASLEDLKAELIEVRQVAVDQDGKMLVWAGGATSTPRPAAAFVRAPEHTPLSFTPSHLTEKILAARHTLEGERKQVTVLFADIKGSTELIEGLDPEEARTLLDPVLHVMMEAVHRYEGTVNQVLGDGIMASFGAPLAHEDHALRACYVALTMQAAMRRSAETVRRRHGVEVQIRVGLNSGLVFEDLHWIDTETQTPLDSLVESLPAARILLLVNYRPAYQHGWGSKTYYTQQRLDPLPPASADELLQCLLGDDASLQPLEQLLIERSEGNPFFLEESVRTLVETQVLVGERGRYRLPQALPSIQVPATVQAVLAARIDRLPPAEKCLLQTAAVIGTELPFPLLQAIAEVPEEALRVDLAHLQAAEFLYETSIFPEREYTFKHALIHEVAYGSLLHERRRTLHARIVEAIEGLYPDRLADHVDRLAHHAWRGAQWDKAVTYCWQTGDKAADRAAFREAVTAFERATEALAHLPETPDTRRLAIEPRRDLGDVLVPMGEPGRSRTLFGKAEALARQLDDRAQLVQVLAMVAAVRRMQGDLDGATAAGRQALELAAELGDGALQAATSHRLGQAYYAVGDLGRAAALLRRNVAALEPSTAAPDSYYRIASRAWLALVLSACGEFAEGACHGEEALRLATADGRGDTSVVAYGCLGLLYLTKGDLEQAVWVLDQGLALCRATGNRDWSRVIAAGLGYAHALAGRLAEGRALLEEALGEGLRTGALQAHALLIARLSDVCLWAGRRGKRQHFLRRSDPRCAEHERRDAAGEKTEKTDVRSACAQCERHDALLSWAMQRQPTWPMRMRAMLVAPLGAFTGCRKCAESDVLYVSPILLRMPKSGRGRTVGVPPLVCGRTSR